jgi:simple sugar transport system ATP-binding protein
VRALCSRATILRQGRVVGTVDPRQMRRADLAAMMLGTLPSAVTRSGITATKTRLALSDITTTSAGPFGTPLDKLSLDVHAGEVLGIAGVAGNGQDELIAVLSGEVPPSAGTIQLDGNAIETLGANARRVRGLAVIPEERNDRAAVLDFTLNDNRLMTSLRDPALVQAGWIKSAALVEATTRTIRDYQIKAEGPAALGRSLSGGNLQKFIVGRALQTDPGVLVAASPTWGVDTGSATAIRRLLVKSARDGGAVVVISQDLEELLAISDRLVVLTRGRISPPLTPDRFNPTLLGLWMTIGAPWSEPDIT